MTIDSGPPRKSASPILVITSSTAASSSSPSAAKTETLSTPILARSGRSPAAAAAAIRWLIADSSTGTISTFHVRALGHKVFGNRRKLINQQRDNYQTICKNLFFNITVHNWVVKNIYGSACAGNVRGLEKTVTSLVVACDFLNFRGSFA